MGLREERKEIMKNGAMKEIVNKERKEQAKEGYKSRKNEK